MEKLGKKNINGQVMVLFVFALFAFLAIGVVLVDGGNLLMTRRAAQAAADAGALAGAKNLCSGASISAATTAALDYAISKNPTGTSTTASIDSTTGQVTVNSIIPRTSFLAQLFKINNVNVSAAAGAGCYSPNTGVTLPVAWSCQPPLNGAPTTSPDCRNMGIPWVDFEKLTKNSGPVTIKGTVIGSTPFDFKTNILPSSVGELYVIMDSLNVVNDLYCYSDANMDVICPALPSGGQNYYITMSGGGERGWLDLTQKNGGNDLVDLMNGTKTVTTTIHTWYSGSGGNKASAYDAAIDIANLPYTDSRHAILMPVFNTLCPSTSSITTACLNAAHSTTDPGLPLGPGDTEIYKLASGSHDQFHIVGFAGFFVTCATKNSSSTACPGKNLALSIGALPAANKGTIEGYFLSGYTFQSTSGTGGVNVGINMVSLNQ